MAESIKVFIDKIFDSSSDNNHIEDDNIHLLFSIYQDIDEKTKLASLQALVDVLHGIQIFNIKKWCLILSKLLTYSSKSETFGDIFQIFIPTPNGNYTTTDILGRKLGLLVLSNYILPIIKETKINSDILSKLLYYISQCIDDKIVGIIASSLISQYIKQMSNPDFHLIMSPIIQVIFAKHKTLNNCPQLYPIVLSLKEEHMSALPEEHFHLPDFRSENELAQFINMFKRFNNETISIYFNSFALSSLLKPFWDLLIDCLANDKVSYRERELVLNCVVETICPPNSSGIDLAGAEHKLNICDIIWSNPRVWELFMSYLSDEKSLFQGLCKSMIIQIRSKLSTNSKSVFNHLFKYFLSIIDIQSHLIESNIPQAFRLSHCLILSVKDSHLLIEYINLLMSFFQSNDIQNYQKVYIIEQIAYVCHSTTDIDIHNMAINSIVSIQTQDIARVSFLAETVKRSSFLAVISCIHHSVLTRNLSMEEYLRYLQSIIDMVMVNLKKDSLKFKIPLTMFKSLAKYIEEQLEFQFNNEEISSKVFPCFGSVICYLSLFLLSKINLKECEESLGALDQIINWIKQCFQAAYKSIECNRNEIEIPSRKRMLSISSLCSEDDNEDTKSVENQQWSFYLIDILLKIYDEDVALMNEAVNNIVSLMIRTKTWGIAGIRYVKNLILSDKARRRKLSEFDSVMRANTVCSLSRDANQDLLKSYQMKERCLNILSATILEDEDVDIIASCLFILLDVCSGKDQILTKQIESLITTFKEKSKSSVGFYLNGNNVIRAINSILSLSNDASHYDNFNVMASNMIIGLINRVDLNSETITSFTEMLNDNFYGSISFFQKSILQIVFVENVQLAWHMRKCLLTCIEKSDVLRLTKYKAFCIINSLVSYKGVSMDDSEFVLQLISQIVHVLTTLNFESLNAKFFSVILESLIGSIKISSKFYKLPSDLLSKLKDILTDKKRNELHRLVNKFLQIYENKSFNLQMISIEKLNEYDRHVSYLLKLLPAEFNKDLDHDNVLTKSDKPVKEIKTLSKFNLIKQKGMSTDATNKIVLKKRRSEDLSQSTNKKKAKLEEPQTPKSKNVALIQDNDKQLSAKPKKAKRQSLDNKKVDTAKPADLNQSATAAKNIDGVAKTEGKQKSKKQKKGKKQISENQIVASAKQPNEIAANSLNEVSAVPQNSAEKLSKKQKKAKKQSVDLNQSVGAVAKASESVSDSQCQLPQQHKKAKKQSGEHKSMDQSGANGVTQTVAEQSVEKPKKQKNKKKKLAKINEKAEAMEID